MKRARKMRAYFQRLFDEHPSAKEVPGKDFVRALLPAASFTQSMKKPGVRKELLRALRKLTPEQLEIARDNGWTRGLI